MLVAAARRSALSATRPMASALAATSRRTMCTLTDGVQVDMVCRVWSGKVKDDSTAHALDCQFEDWLDVVADVEGCAGATRLLCKSEWDYKLILKFEDTVALKNYMENDHDRISAEHMPALEELLVGGSFKQQNFVYDDIE